MSVTRRGLLGTLGVLAFSTSIPSFAAPKRTRVATTAGPLAYSKGYETGGY